MKIISKRGLNDYYDYICDIEGIDNRVIFDRRKPFIIHKEYCGDIISDYYLKALFGNEIIKTISRSLASKFDDSPKYMHIIYKRILGKHWPRREECLAGNIFLMCLEVGFIQWYFEIERYIDEDGKLHVERRLIDKKRLSHDKKVSNSVISIIPCSRSYSGEIRFEHDSTYTKSSIIEFENPILKYTWIPNFIDAHEIYDAIYEYCSSKNDHEFVDTRTNDEHIESNGFDRKTSFRNIK